MTFTRLSLALGSLFLAACTSADPIPNLHTRLQAPGGSWLKGDLHVHSNHSTDAADSPVADIVKRATELGFDYLAITDHDNHVNGKITTWSDPALSSSSLVMLYGVEWTTGKGHANLFGTAPWDHESLYALRDGDGATSIARAHAMGLHFSVNHPSAKDLWELGFELPYDSMEVWTAPFLLPDNNVGAILKWDELLRAGRRIPARGGSDSHHQATFEAALFNIGNPTTWVFAQDRSTAGILEGLAAGHVTISYAAAAERLELEGDADGDGVFELLPGDTAPAGATVSLRVRIANPRPGISYDVRIAKNGWPWKLLRLQGAAPEATLVSDPSADPAYYRVELHASTPLAPILGRLAFGDMVALTNPVYIGYR